MTPPLPVGSVPTTIVPPASANRLRRVMPFLKPRARGELASPDAAELAQRDRNRTRASLLIASRIRCAGAGRPGVDASNTVSVDVRATLRSTSVLMTEPATVSVAGSIFASVAPAFGQASGRLLATKSVDA